MVGAAPLLRRISDDAVLIDTSNYYPARDGRMAAIDDGQVESVWVSEMLGRPVAKTWNAIGSGSLAAKGTEKGSPSEPSRSAGRRRDRTNRHTSGSEYGRLARPAQPRDLHRCLPVHEVAHHTLDSPALDPPTMA